MACFVTRDRHGYSVKFSPFNPNRLAVATSQHFGITGSGTLFILDIQPNGTLTETLTLNWPDGLYDLAWSEFNDCHLLSCSGDGSLQLWDLNSIYTPPILYHEHQQEVCSVDWVKTRKEQIFLSTSWDSKIKLWDPNRKESIFTYVGHVDSVYQAVVSLNDSFASVGADGFLKIWETSSHQPCLSIKAHDAQILSCDWSKYDHNLVVTAASDHLIRGWDLRNYSQPVFQLKGHDSAIKKVQFSPHDALTLASVSCDFSTRIWDLTKSSHSIEVVRHHSEFVYGLDWNLLRKGQLADCGWDSFVHVFIPNSLNELGFPKS